MGTQHIAKGSVILVDEVHTQSGDDLNSGDGSTVEEFAVPVMRMWEFWGLPGRPKGVCDDGIFAKFGGRNAPSVADQFRNFGVTFNKAGKGFRRGGWELMRSMLSKAGSDKPGLYFTDLAGYALSAIPFLPRDPRRSDDVRSDGPDHAADAVRYALLGSGTVEKKQIGSYYGRAAHAREIERGWSVPCGSDTLSTLYLRGLTWAFGQELHDPNHQSGTKLSYLSNSTDLRLKNHLILLLKKTPTAQLRKTKEQKRFKSSLTLSNQKRIA